jgi:hypothetical protein
MSWKLNFCKGERNLVKIQSKSNEYTGVKDMSDKA